MPPDATYNIGTDPFAPLSQQIFSCTKQGGSKSHTAVNPRTYKPPIWIVYTSDCWHVIVDGLLSGLPHESQEYIYNFYNQKSHGLSPFPSENDIKW